MNPLLELQKVESEIQNLKTQYSKLLTYLDEVENKLRNLKFEIIQYDIFYRLKCPEGNCPNVKVQIGGKEVDAFYYKYSLNRVRLSKKHAVTYYLHVFKTVDNEIVVILQTHESYVHKGHGKVYTPLHAENIILYIDSKKRVFFKPRLFDEYEFSRFIKILKKLGIEQKQINFIVAIYKQYVEYQEKFWQLVKKHDELREKIKEIENEMKRHEIKKQIEEKKQRLMEELKNVNTKEIYEKLKERTKVKINNIEIEVRPTLRPEVKQICKVIVRTEFESVEKEVEVEYGKRYLPNLRSWERYINFESEKTKINIIKIINECINEILSKLK